MNENPWADCQKVVETDPTIEKTNNTPTKENRPSNSGHTSGRENSKDTIGKIRILNQHLKKKIQK